MRTPGEGIFLTAFASVLFQHGTKKRRTFLIIYNNFFVLSQIKLDIGLKIKIILIILSRPTRACGLKL